MAEIQSPGGKSRLIWRAVVLSWIAWCLGIKQHVVTHGSDRR